MLIFIFFFFKQKTAYEMRISDWSSDVCSSDLALLRVVANDLEPAFGDLGEDTRFAKHASDLRAVLDSTLAAPPLNCTGVGARSEERRVGKECVSTCRSRWSPYH